MTHESVGFTVDEFSVLAYLKANPEFFTRHPKFLAALQLPNPHGDGVVSLSTKQVALLRAQLQEKTNLLDALIDAGNTNDTIQAQIHQLSLALMRANSVKDLQTALEQHIQVAFELSHASLHLLDREAKLPEAFTDWLQAQTKPYCNESNAAIDAFIASQNLAINHASFGVIPMLSEDRAVAFILLASEDAQHFTDSMETDFLSRIGELFYTRFTALDKA